MKKEIIKKVLVAVVVLLSLSTAFVTAAPNIKLTEEKNMIEKTGSGSFDEESELVTFVIEMSPKPPNSYGKRSITSSSNKDADQNIRYEVQLTASEADYLVRSLEILEQELASAKTDNEIMDISKEKLKLLRDAGILPSSFTMKNINETTEMFRNIASDTFFPNSFKKNSPDTLLPATIPLKTDGEFNDDGFHFGWPYVGLAAGYFYMVFLGEAQPFLTKNYFVIGNATAINLSEIPILQNLSEMSFFQNSTMLQNGTIQGGWIFGINYFNILYIPAPATIGIMSLVSLEKPKGWALFGSLYGQMSLISAMGPHIVFSLTVLYQRGPCQVYVPLFDFGVFGLSGVFAIPFWYEKNEPAPS